MKWLNAFSGKRPATSAPSEQEIACASFGPKGLVLFDADWYLEQVGDPGLDRTTAFDHFLEQGWMERRNPSPLFDTGYYLDTYPDVARSGSNPLLHYVEHGHKEGRTIRPFRFESKVVEFQAESVENRPELPKGPERHWSVSERTWDAFQTDHFVMQYEFMGFGRISGAQARELYAHSAAARRISPNSQFDEMWYLTRYADIGQAVRDGEVASGFAHFCDSGWHEGRLPSEAWQTAANARQTSEDIGADHAETVLEDDAQAAALLKAFPFVTPLEFVRKVGISRRITVGLNSDMRPSMQAAFDETYYREQWAAVSRDPIEGDAFDHYYTVGCRKRLSPNRQFDEGFYMAFYKDIREVVEDGSLICGFEHYLLSGRREGRLARHDLKKALELSIPGVTEPGLLHRVDDIDRRMSAPRVLVDEDAPKTFWVVLPRLDPDIAFGGYRALFELVVALRGYGPLADYRFKVLLTEVSSSNLDYFLFKTPQKHIVEAFAGMDCACLDPSRPVTLNPDDYVLAYSAWDAHIAARLAEKTRHPRFIQLVQEYEAIFHDFNSHHAMTNAGFSLPSYVVFNSQLLADFFRDQKLGIFSDGKTPEAKTDYLSFEHIPTPARLQAAADMALRETRTCIVYARPEGHAARNLFEILLLALRRACREGVFDDNWRFVGIGCLSEMDPIPLAGRHVLDMVPKLPEAEYKELLGSVDIGVSLMYAPHPSVVPFELCTTGALVVVNTFLNRDEEFFLSKSKNFIPIPPTIDGVVEGLKAAAARVGETRARANDAMHLTRVTWPQTFSDEVLSTIVAGVTGPEDQTPTPVRAAKPAAERAVQSTTRTGATSAARAGRKGTRKA